jgi:hypothetical protein
MLVGVGAFSWASVLFALVPDAYHPDPCWPVYLIGGGSFGAAATIVTRDAGRRSVGRFLAALGYISVCTIVFLFLRDGRWWFIALTLLSIPLWLFLSSRAGRRGSEEPSAYGDVFR